MRIRRHAELAESLLPWRTAISDHTRFQEDFGEDLASGEVLDQAQLNYIDYFRRWHDMQLNEKGLYRQRNPVTEWVARPEGPDGPTVITVGGIKDNSYPPEWQSRAEELARDTGGFTIVDDPNLPGDAPSSGYQVAIPGYDTTEVSTGPGWAEWARENNELLSGPTVGMGTWRNSEDGLYYTEPSETIDDYDDAARSTVERDQWSMWDNGAFVIDPVTGDKVFLPQADIPRTDIVNQGPAGAMGFTLAHREWDY